MAGVPSDHRSPSLNPLGWHAKNASNATSDICDVFPGLEVRGGHPYDPCSWSRWDWERCNHIHPLCSAPAPLVADP